MPISERTAKTIWGQCAGRCAICKKGLIHQEEGRTPSLVGEVAHIVGETVQAARGRSPLSVEERNHPDNLVLLCREHHKVVDDDPSTYPVGALQEVKRGHLRWVADGLQEPRSWRSPISQLTYINVPRVSELAASHGYRLDLPTLQPGQPLHDLGWELGHLTLALSRVLSGLPISALSTRDLALHDSQIGRMVAFDRQRFRTKNVPLSSKPGPRGILTGDAAKDPQVYLQKDDVRVVLLIDPAWITTATAYMLFRSGQAMFSGFGRVTNVDYEARILTVTPWALGIPDGSGDGFDEAVQDNINEVLVKLDGLVDLERGKRDSIYFQGAPSHCDTCGKNLMTEKYLIDGATNSDSAWAFMCAECFAKNGVKIGWGTGQLYLRQGDAWLEVAGFPPAEAGDAVDA